MSNLGYDSFLAICAVVLIPVLLWWYRQAGSKNIKFYGYFLILFFAQGSLHLTHAINATVLRYLFETPFVLLYLKSVYSKDSVGYPGRWLIAPFLIVAIISSIQNSVTMLVFFVLYTLEVFMTLYYYRNSIKNNEAGLLNKLFIYLCVAQIGASLIKYSIIGITEPYIGTMSEHEGGITTLFSLCAYCVSLEFYFCTRNKKMLLLVLGFILFGMIGAKRALAFFFPVFFFVTLMLHSYFNKSLAKNARMLLMGSLLMPILFYAYCRINPSLNPEQEVGGSFDIEFILDYSKQYNNGTLTSDGDGVGRSETIAVIAGNLVESDVFTMLFGHGSGLLITSGFNEIAVSDDYTQQRFGVGYGLGIGLAWMLVQVGFVGAFLYFMLFVKGFNYIYKKTKILSRQLSSIELGWCISGLLILLCVLIVTCVYNKTAIYLNCCSVAIMWFLSYALRILDNTSSKR